MKVKLIYNGNNTSKTQEVNLPQIPRVGDCFCVLTSNEKNREFASCVVESVDWWIENGKLRNVELYLKDEK